MFPFHPPFGSQTETRAEVSATALLSLDRFDDIYNKRRKDKEAALAAVPKKPDLLFEKPDLKTLLQLLRQMLSAPDSVVASSEKLLELAIYLGDDVETFGRNHIFFAEIAQVPDATETFLQLILMLTERHTTIIASLVEVCGRCGLALASTRKLFTKRCLEMLGVFMRAGGQSAEAAKKTLEEIVIPSLKEFSEGGVVHRVLASLAKDFPVLAKESLASEVGDLATESEEGK